MILYCLEKELKKLWIYSGNYCESVERMKKVLKSLVGIILLFNLTGCIKYNTEISINEDKSMDFTMIMAVDKSLMTGDDASISENLDDLKKIEDQGFKVTDYSDDKMEGYRLYRRTKNIDNISTKEDCVYNIGSLMDGIEDSYMFKVKKGLLKNTYYAKLSMDEESYGEEETKPEENNFNDDMNLDDFGEQVPGNNFDSDLSGMEDYLQSSMDISFVVKLPNAAISSNANNTKDDGKELEWTLSFNEADNKYIEFEFEVYNQKVLYILYIFGAGFVLSLILFIFSEIKNWRNGKKLKPLTWNKTSPTASKVAMPNQVPSQQQPMNPPMPGQIPGQQPMNQNGNNGNNLNG